jgi:hypothetical protein
MYYYIHTIQKVIKRLKTEPPGLGSGKRWAVGLDMWRGGFVEVE